MRQRSRYRSHIQPTSKWHLPPKGKTLNPLQCRPQTASGRQRSVLTILPSALSPTSLQVLPLIDQLRFLGSKLLDSTRLHRYRRPSPFHPQMLEVHSTPVNRVRRLHITSPRLEVSSSMARPHITFCRSQAQKPGLLPSSQTFHQPRSSEETPRLPPQPTSLSARLPSTTTTM